VHNVNTSFMVINGKNILATQIAVAKFEGDRIRIPTNLVEPAGLAGKLPIDFWFLVVSPGRYRLLKRPTSSTRGDLPKIIRKIEEVGESGDVLDGTDSNAEAAIAARMVPCVASPRGPGWRIDVPKVIRKLAYEREESSYVYLLMVAGFVELWFPDTLRCALSVPISELLS
jgi:hypothetical protein